jgi:two-component SAPR family response regulator
LSKLRDQLDGDKAGETINQLEDKIRQLNVENLRLQENSVNVDGLQLNYFLEKTNIFATGFKATFHNLVKTQQLLNPKTITYWENAEVLEEYKYIFRYIHQENINVHNESLSTMKGIMGDVIQGLLQNPEFIESASKASQGF